MSSTALTRPTFQGTTSNVTNPDSTPLSSKLVTGMVVTDSPLMFRNRIINGDMRIDQRATATSTSGAFTVDRWVISRSDDAVVSCAQNTDAPAGFTHSLRQTITTADASIGAAQYNGFEHRVEGFNIADFAWGTVAAKPVTLSFWIRSSVIGQYTGNVRNKDDTRICPFSYSISAANTWEFKIVTIPGCPDGTWLTNNDVGLRLQLYAALGSNYLGGVDGAWNSTLRYGSGSPVNGLNANGNIFAITGVQLEAGPVATPFERRPIAVETQMCQRYYERGSTIVFATTEAGTSVYLAGTANFKVSKRATPGVLTTADLVGNAGKWSNFSVADDTVTNNVNIAAIFGIDSNVARLRYLYQPSGASKNNLFCYWTADAEL